MVFWRCVDQKYTLRKSLSLVMKLKNVCYVVAFSVCWPLTEIKPRLNLEKKLARTKCLPNTQQFKNCQSLLICLSRLTEMRSRPSHARTFVNDFLQVLYYLPEERSSFFVPATCYVGQKTCDISIKLSVRLDDYSECLLFTLK